MDSVTLIAPTHHEWQERFAHHATVLSTILPDAKIEHIGSTSLGFIYAKDVVDIMIGVSPLAITPASRLLVQNGYISEGDTPTHAWLCWPNNIYRKVVVHVLEYQGRQWTDRIIFRDYLATHHDVAAEYEALKSSITVSRPTWAAYTNQKSNFVSSIVKKVRSITDI
ncbi:MULTISPECIES: GrpB family protein [unclassified Xanthobacter]|uniref:GrpB family protein n=1 Tax=unclassified Xanthobacter TaxID=2623496 RepID=UPI001F298EF4|nr:MULTISPECIES: GrpB family protein [unclassified Xanthobacter]